MKLVVTICSSVLIGSLIGEPAGAQCSPAEVAGLSAAGNQPWDSFGADIALSGDTVLVGASRYPSTTPSIGGGGPGAAFFYERDPLDAHQWTLARTLSSPIAHTSFGWTVALDGDTAAIACKEPSAPQLYVVRVYERNAGGPNAWGHVATLRNDYYPAGINDVFGRGLAVDGDRIAVGAPYYGGPTTSSGSVYLFERDAGGPGQWGKVARIVRPGPPMWFVTDFGRVLSLDRDALLIGDVRSGTAHLHERDAGGLGQWGLVTTFDEPPFGPYSGSHVLAVALHDDELMIGRQFFSQTMTTWFVRVHRRDFGGVGNWGLAQSLVPTGGSPFTRFGCAIDFDATRALIGAKDDLGWPSRDGAVYVFQRAATGAAWGQAARLTASDSMNWDDFGLEVALERNTAVIGNERNGSGSLHLGNVHVFDLESPAPPVSYCTAGTSSNGCSGTLLGVGGASASDVDGFELVAIDLDGQRNGAVFYSASGPQALPVQGTTNWRCVKSPLQRLGIASSAGTIGACDGSLRIDWNAFRAANPSALGAPFSAGQTLWAQAWWRDGASSGVSTQGLSFSLCP